MPTLFTVAYLTPGTVSNTKHVLGKCLGDKQADVLIFVDIVLYRLGLFSAVVPGLLLQRRKPAATFSQVQSGGW